MAMESEEANGSPTFCLVHGRYHSGWCWQSVQEELAIAGWNSIAPTLPIEDPEMTLDDHASFLKQVKLERGLEESIDVGHSWGANIIARTMGSNAVKQLIFIAPSFHPATLKHPTRDRPLSYDLWKKYEETAGFDLQAMKEFASFAFYDDVSDEELKEEALNRLREHPTREIEPELEEFPDLPIEYVLTVDDKAVSPYAQADTAEVLGVNPVCFKSGHAPMLAQPEKLAEKLIELAIKN
jgi:hypothetical protein